MTCFTTNICLLINLIVLTNCFGQQTGEFESAKCEQDLYFSAVLKPEIQSKATIVNKIIDSILNSDEKNQTFKELSEYVDTFGARLSGSEALENSTNFLVEKLKNENLDNVYTEDVAVPHWQRGLEWATMIEPRAQKLSILGLVGSVKTPNDGITAQLIVFNSVEELHNISDNNIKNKIVLINANEVNGSNVKFTLQTTRMVAEAGGLAVLFRSNVKDGLYSVNTGIIRYFTKDTQIPVASIAAEDSELLSRISKRELKIVINLYLDSKFHGFNESKNLIAELIGTQYPNEMVIVSAHMDSWDVGQGAVDDGGGVLISLRALTLLNKLELRPKRTLRLVLFTGEEVGRFGSKAYVKKHKENMKNISLIMNSDLGTFKPFGLTFSGLETRAQCVVYQTLQLLEAINSTKLMVGTDVDLEQGDAGLFIDEGVPAAGLLNDNKKYWRYSHTKADTVSAIDPYFLDLCSIVWTTISYVLADLSIKLPNYALDARLANT